MFLSCRCIYIVVAVVVIVVVVSVVAGTLGWYFTRGDDHEPSPTGDDHEPSPTEVRYYKEAVATDNKNCSKIGEDILDQNGSAVDAAIAAIFCLGVINMHSSGIGGGGVMLVYNRSHGEAKVLDFRETAPASVTNFTTDPSGVSKSKLGLYSSHRHLTVKILSAFRVLLENIFD